MRSGDSAGLVELQRLKQTRDEVVAQVRLVLDERIRQREVGDGGGRGPRGKFFCRTQRVVHALVESLADERGIHRAIEQHDGVVITDEAGRADDRRGDFFGAVETHDFLNQVDGTVEVVTPARDGECPGRAAILGGLFTDDGEFEGFEGGALVGGGDFEAELFVDVGGRDGDLALPRNVGADTMYRSGNYATRMGEDQVDEAVGGFVERVNIDAALVAVGRVGGEAEALDGSADGLAFEIGDFEDEVSRIG